MQNLKKMNLNVNLKNNLSKVLSQNIMKRKISLNVLTQYDNKSNNKKIKKYAK